MTNDAAVDAMLPEHMRAPALLAHWRDRALAAEHEVSVLRSVLDSLVMHVAPPLEEHTYACTSHDQPNTDCSGPCMRIRAALATDGVRSEQ